MAEYDAVTARHYAAYRPPLHGKILDKAFGPEERFRNGLDIGCGVGHSTHALARYCAKVTGIDPSKEMIALAKAIPDVQFVAQRIGDGFFNANFLDGGYDLYTFAGSLFYENAQETLEEVYGLAREKAAIVVYDFDVDLRSVFAALGKAVPFSEYDHRRNFSGMVQPKVLEVLSWEGTIGFQAAPAELAHLLFSVSAWREEVFREWDFASLVKGLEELATAFELAAACYLTRYLLLK